jgi:hypothetical protein
MNGMERAHARVALLAFFARSKSASLMSPVPGAGEGDGRGECNTRGKKREDNGRNLVHVSCTVHKDVVGLEVSENVNESEEANTHAASNQARARARKHTHTRTHAHTHTRTHTHTHTHTHTSPVNIIMQVQVLERNQDLACVELDFVLFKTRVGNTLQQLVQLGAGAVSGEDRGWRVGGG